MARSSRLATERMTEKGLWNVMLTEIDALKRAIDWTGRSPSDSARALRRLDAAARELRMRGTQLTLTGLPADTRKR